jgi:hypothetical protein
MVHTLEKDAEFLQDNIDKLERAMVCADENGLFKVCKTVQCTEITDYFIDAFRDLKTFNTLEDKNGEDAIRLFGEAWRKYRVASHLFNKAINDVGFWWRFKNHLGGLFLIYLLVLLGISFSLWILVPNAFDSKLLWVPSYAFMWGFIGGILQGFWYLWRHISDRELRKVWTPWYLLLPFMGAILGALTYLVFYAGFFATTGTANIQSESFIILICALAGFSTVWAVDTLTNITKQINIGSRTENKGEGKN